MKEFFFNTAILIGVLLAICAIVFAYKLIAGEFARRELHRRFDALLLIRHELKHINISNFGDRTAREINIALSNDGFFRLRAATKTEKLMGGAEWTVFIRAASSDGRVATASILIPEKRKASIVVALVRGNTSPMSGGSMQSDRRILAQEQLLEEDVRKLLALAM